MQRRPFSATGAGAAPPSQQLYVHRTAGGAGVLLLSLASAAAAAQAPGSTRGTDRGLASQPLPPRVLKAGCSAGHSE